MERAAQVEYNASANHAIFNRGCSEVSLKRLTFLFAAALFAGLAAMAAAGVPAQMHITPSSLTAAKSLGSSSAPIRIDEFSDFQCPACGNFYRNTLRQVIDNYVSAGKVFVVHHDFPLNMHAHSREAARWANAAAAVGLFEPVEQALFAKQDDWGATGKIEPDLADALSPAEMKKIETIYGQDAPQLDAAIDSDLADGHTRNINQTPTIYVTSHGTTQELPPGGVTYTLMKQYLDYLLAH
jgi:protein-disulfide isomerase